MSNKIQVNGNFIRCERLVESEKQDNDDFVFKKESFNLYKVNDIFLSKPNEYFGPKISIGDILMLEDIKGTLIKINEKEFIIPIYSIIAKVIM